MQVTFKAYLPNGQGSSKSSSNKIIDLYKQEVALGNLDGELSLPKRQTGIQVFFLVLLTIYFYLHDVRAQSTCARSDTSGALYLHVRKFSNLSM